MPASQRLSDTTANQDEHRRTIGLADSVSASNQLIFQINYRYMAFLAMPVFRCFAWRPSRALATPGWRWRARRVIGNGISRLDSMLFGWVQSMACQHVTATHSFTNQGGPMG